MNTKGLFQMYNTGGEREREREEGIQRGREDCISLNLVGNNSTVVPILWSFSTCSNDELGSTGAAVSKLVFIGLRKPCLRSPLWKRYTANLILKISTRLSSNRYSILSQ